MMVSVQKLSTQGAIWKGKIRNVVYFKIYFFLKCQLSRFSFFNLSTFLCTFSVLKCDISRVIFLFFKKRTLCWIIVCNCMREKKSTVLRCLWPTAPTINKTVTALWEWLKLLARGQQRQMKDTIHVQHQKPLWHRQELKSPVFYRPPEHTALRCRDDSRDNFTSHQSFTQSKSISIIAEEQHSTIRKGGIRLRPQTHFTFCIFTATPKSCNNLYFLN